MNWLLYIAALLPMLGLAALFGYYRQSQAVDTDETAASPTPNPAGERPFTQRLGELPLYRERGNTWRAARRRSRRIAGLSLTLQRCGIVNPRDQLALFTSVIAGAFFVGATCALWLWMLNREPARIATAALGSCFGLIAFVFAGIRRHAAQRQLNIERETPTVIQMTRMLWRAGLSLPRTFAVLCEELQQLAPETTRELRRALQKINTGQSQEETLAELAELTTAEGFREYLVITRQVSQSGGAVDQALADLYQLLQNQRRTGLQEKVSKLSAKMSLVMMLLLFPALLIVLGGPGFTAIGAAMSNMSSK